MDTKNILRICSVLEILLFFTIIWVEEMKFRLALFSLYIFVIITKQRIKKKCGITFLNNGKQ